MGLIHNFISKRIRSFPGGKSRHLIYFELPAGLLEISEISTLKIL